MIREPTPQDILPLIVEYLKAAGLKKTAKQVDASYEHDVTPLQGKSLVRIVKHYIKSHESLVQQFQEVAEESEIEESTIEEIVEVKKSKLPPVPKIVKDDNFEEPVVYKKKFFQKVDDDNIHTIPVPLKDNSYEAKARFGTAGDEYGQMGNQKLRDTRGDEFKKQKSKLKNRQFAGAGTINTNSINSIKL